MNTRFILFQLPIILFLLGIAGLGKIGYAQPKISTTDNIVQQATQSDGLFSTDTVLVISIKGSIKEMLADRSDKPAAYPVTITYKNDDGTEIAIPAEGKTRGHFRKLTGNCMYPPVLLQFKNSEELSHSIFKQQKKLKLVMPCVSDQFIVREWLVYKLYNLVTPESFKARLVQVHREEDMSKKKLPPFYGIVLEEEEQMANRNGMVAVNRKLKREQLYPDAFLKMAVFEYLIGNTDWSVEYLQNIKLIALDSLTVPTAVPYDFDHAGIVNAPYAKPAEELLMYGIRQRRYRGYCIKEMKDFAETISLFNKLKNDIYGLYTNCTLLDEKYKKATLKYLDQFYNTINNEALVKKDFSYPCDISGTDNIVIKGMKDE